jgi:hypothetical protein
MTARKELKKKLMKARHYLQVSSEIIGKHRYPNKKIRPHYLLKLNNHENGQNDSSATFAGAHWLPGGIHVSRGADENPFFSQGDWRSIFTH